jgi:Bifunctional DNA primase/polymerase, N-terminal
VVVAVSRRRLALRDAALSYASRGIPVLPLHYPVTRPKASRPVSAGQLERPSWPVGCSCGDPGCGQVGKHPLGTLVPHGLHEATTNRARVLAWWTRFPQASIGLACGHRFDVLDLDGPGAVEALADLTDRHGLELLAGGPVARTGREEAGWHYYLAPAGLARRSPVLERVDYQGRGAYVVAPPSRHASGRPYRWVRDLDHPLPTLPERLQAELERPPTRPATPVLAGVPAADTATPAYVRSALATELARLAGAPVGRRNRQLWESGRNLFNFVAAGALDHAEVERGLLQAAERNGLLAEEPRQTRRTIDSARRVGLDHPRHPPQRPDPDRTPAQASPSRIARDGGERIKERR